MEYNRSAGKNHLAQKPRNKILNPACRKVIGVFCCAMNAPTSPPTTLLASLRALPRPAWTLCFGTFLNKFGAFVVPFLTLYLTKEGYSVADAGIAVGAYGVGVLLASLLGGHLADHDWPTPNHRPFHVFRRSHLDAAFPGAQFYAHHRDHPARRPGQ